MHGPRLRPVPVPGLQQEVALSRQFHRRVDPLLHREGTSRNGWQPTADALLTMELLRQPVATHGNGFRLFWRVPGRSDSPPIATGCNHGAPYRLPPTLPLLATAPLQGWP